jgi:hypothetical protein
MTTLTLPSQTQFSTPSDATSLKSPLEKLKTPDELSTKKTHSLTNTSLTALADTAGRIADVFDSAITLPKLVGDTIGTLNIPMVSWAASTVGSILAGSLGCFAHGLTFGAGKWLQGVRRWTGVHNGVNDAFGNTEEIASITAKSFLSGVKDPSVANDLKEYFTLHTNLQSVSFDTTLTDEQRTDRQVGLKRQLVQLELKLSRRAELNEFKALINADDDPAPVAHKKLEELADTMASKLIARVEDSHKERLGFLGSKMEGSWMALAAQGESGREVLRQRIKDRLITAYEAEQRNESGRTAMAEARQSLMESFGAKSAFREGGFYLVLGVLIHTGALSGFISTVAEHSDKIGNAITQGGLYLWNNFVPEAIRETVNQGLLYAKWAFGGVAALYAGKGVSFVYGIGKGAYEMFGPHTDTAHTTTASSPSDVKVADPTHIDTATHSAVGTPKIDPLQSHLDALRTDALASPTTAPHAADISSALKSNIEVGNPGAPHVDTATLRTTAELKVAPDSIRADGVRLHPDIHIK